VHALICVWAVAVTGALGVLAKYIEKHKDAGITSAFMELGTSLSFAAASCNDSETIDYLHDAGVNLSTGRAGDGVTPLIAAAALESIEAMEALLCAGADPLVSSSSGVTPLLEAAEHGHWKAGRTLLAHSSAPDPDYALPDG